MDGGAQTGPHVPAWLEEGVRQAGEQVTVIAQNAYRLRAVRIDQPLLVLPLAGIKRIDVDGNQAEITAGQFVMLHRSTQLSLENLPPAGADQAYRAWCITFPWRVVVLARQLLSAHGAPTARAPTQAFSNGAIAPLLPALRSFLGVVGDAGSALHPAQADHALLGLLLALAHIGHGQFLHAHDLSLAGRIRLLIAAAPARDWSSVDFEEALHISGATLRRRLAQEETSLRALLRETRLHHGLNLLQSSRKPLKAIAHASGYRSVPSFSRNFSAHFGVEPSALAPA